MSDLLPIKLLVVGDSGVGKSCIILKYVGEPVNANPTIGIDFKIKTVALRGKKIRLQIWDTAGQERYNSISPQFYRDAKGAMVVYDTTSEKSFKDIGIWLQNVYKNGDDGIRIMLLGNKADLVNDKVVSKERGMKFALENGIPFMETSMMDYMSIENAFRILIGEIPFPDKKPTPDSKTKSNIRVDGDKNTTANVNVDQRGSTFRCC